MDFGFHQSLYRAIMMHSSGLDQIRRSLQIDIDAVGKTLVGLDSRLDKQRFFEYNNAAFMIPKKFEYTPVRRDEVKNPTRAQSYKTLTIYKKFTVDLKPNKMRLEYTPVFGHPKISPILVARELLAL